MVSAARSNMKASAGALVMALSSRSAAGTGLRGPARGLRLDALEGLGLVDDEADMGAGADGVEPVLGGDLEGDLAPLDRRHLDRDLDRHTHERRREMLDRHLHPDRVLARLG